MSRNWFPRPRYWTIALAMVVLALMAVGGAKGGAMGTPAMASMAHGAPPQAPGGNSITPLLERARQEGRIRVIAVLHAHVRPEASLSKEEVTNQRQALAHVSSRVREQLASYEQAGRLIVHRTYEILPALALSVDAEALQALSQLPEVLAVVEDLPFAPTLDTTIPIIGADTVWSRGYSGKGLTVAILDTGVDGNHPFLSGKVVEEACYSSNQGDASSRSYTRSVCPGGRETVIGKGAAVPCFADGCDHGTHVAGIAAGRQHAGMAIPFSGVAKDADVIAVQVFSAKYSDECSELGRSSPCTTAFFSDVVKGMEYVYGLRTSHTIAALNLSLSGYRYLDPTSCDESQWGKLFKTAAANLLNANIAVIAASGNEGFQDSTGMPACVSNIISVGATNDDDTVASFSNSAWFLDLLAPGVQVNAPIPGYGYEYKNGTSMAAPHVTGAWAVLRQVQPGATVQAILTVLKNSGLPITDPRNGLAHPRIRLDAALAALKPVSYGLSVTPPSPDALSHLQGKTVRYAFKIVNTGDVAATYQITLRDHRWATYPSDYQVLLQRGESRVVEIAVDIPADAARGAYDIVTVTVLVVEDNTKQASFVLRTTSQGPPSPGDCNGDGAIDADDFRAMMFRIFRGSYASNASCDANQDNRVDAADFSCTLRLMHGDTCLLETPAAATAPLPQGIFTHRLPDFMQSDSADQSIASTMNSSPSPEVTIAQDIQVHAGDTFALPITVSGNGATIASIAFSLNYDGTLLFDPTDSDRNGIPEAIQFNVPADWRTTVAHDATKQTINVVAFSTASQRTLLPDGTLMVLSFLAGFPSTLQSFPVTISSLSIQDERGTAYSSVANNSSVRIVPQSDTIPILDIPNTISADAGGLVAVPIMFTAMNAQVTAVAFSLGYDMHLLSLDPTDGNQDGIPDALRFSLPTGWTPLVLLGSSGTQGKIDVVVFNEHMPMTVLPKGTILTAWLRVGTPPKTTGTMVAFSSNPSATFGDQRGWSTAGKTGGGVVSIATAQETLPKLAIAQDIFAITGKPVEVPINFSANGQHVAAIAFSLDIDPTVLTYDPIGTKVPLPPGWQHEITYDQTDTSGKLDIVLFSRAEPLTELPDGEVVRLLFTVDNGKLPTVANISFSSETPPSFGDPEGIDVAGVGQSGSIRVGSGFMYLPIILKYTGDEPPTPTPPPATSTPVLPPATSTPIPPAPTSTPVLPPATSTPIPPAPTSTPVLPPPTNTSTPPVTNDFAARVIELTNRERAAHGCPALTMHALLMEAAQKHSEDMAINDYFSHTGLDGSSPGDRIARTGYRASAWAENIAAGYDTPERVVEGWMNSTGHRQNILNCDLKEIGVGYSYLENDTGSVNYRHYWTQVFATPYGMPTPTPEHPPTTPTPTETTVPDNWLAYVNSMRALANLPEVTENSTWSYGCWLHSRYMVKNDVIGHSEDPANEWYTQEGDDAARNGNVAVGSSTTYRYQDAIDMWMTGPFHAIGILDPRLRQVGFGLYTEAVGRWRGAATLDVLRGLGDIPSGVSFPILFPGDGQVMPYTHYRGNEWPDPLTACPGYSAPSGPPLLVQFEETPNVESYRFTKDGQHLEACIFDETSYVNSDAGSQNTGRAVLRMRHAVVLMPREPLTAGTYTTSITENGTEYTWSFQVTQP